MTARFVQPEYTGENRCYPCTVVNTLIAVALTLVLVGGGRFVDFPEVGLAAGGLFFIGSLILILFRGYLVPGTPALTKRYLPPWVLRLFDKEARPPAEAGLEDTTLDTNPERELMRAGILDECETGDDLCLTSEFATAWETELTQLADSDIDRTVLHSVLEIPDGELSFEEYPGAFRARVDGGLVGTWESEAAFHADLASAAVFELQFPGWGRCSVEQKGQLLRAVRLFIEVCPACGETPNFDAETVESCCATHEVAALSCDGCGSRLFETQLS